MTPGNGPDKSGSAGARSAAEDSVLNACLSELLGDEQPPDLSQRILQALAHQEMAASQATDSTNEHPLSSPAGGNEPAGLEESPGRARAGLSTTAGLPTPPVGSVPVGQGTVGGSPTPSRPILIGTGANAVSGETSCQARTSGTSRSGIPSSTLWVAAIAASLLLLVLVEPWKWNSNAAPNSTVVGQGAPTDLPADQPEHSPSEIAGSPGVPTNSPPAAPNVEQDPSPAVASTPNSGNPDHQPESGNLATSQVPSPLGPHAAGQKPTPNVLGSHSLPELSPEILNHSDPQAEPNPSDPKLDEAVVARINALIQQRWREEGVRPAPAATDAEWCRRVYLDVLGRIPTVDETLTYLADRSKTKKSRLVNRLLGDGYALTSASGENYHEQFASNWTTVWTNVFLGRTGGQDNPAVDRAGFQQYLLQSLKANKPYNQLAFELLTAVGANRPGVENYNGAVNFLLDNLAENATPATSKTAQIFLGLQLQCTQCHQHPTNGWKQHHFWEMNAFFRQAQPRSHREQGKLITELVDVDFAGEGPQPDLDAAEIYFEHHTGMMKVAYPAFLDGTKIDPSGRVAEVTRRHELATLITNSEYLPRAAVNRLWAHFLGHGFTAPIDDMGPHSPPSHGELLNHLATCFAAQGYDLKQLVRWITLSEPYGLSSQVPRNSIDDPQAGPPLFSYFYMRQMRAEELYDSMQIATHGTPPAGAEAQLAAVSNDRAKWLEQFSLAYDTDENDEANLFNGGLNQSLMMWNGELMDAATSGSQGTFLHRVASSKLSDVEKIHQLFVAALGRGATTSELRVVQQALRHHRGNSLAALQDLWWTLLNQSEFILNH